jgi:hypothetical protein
MTGSGDTSMPATTDHDRQTSLIAAAVAVALCFLIRAVFFAIG